MRAATLCVVAALTVGALSGCGKAPDPLAGKWDVSMPDDAAKGAVNVFEFRDGKVTFQRRTEVLGIGQVQVTTTGTYTIEGPEITLTRSGSEIDASAIKDPKLREQTVKVMEGMAKATEGKPLKYTLKVESPDRVVLGDPSESITLNRSR
ncbi:hypothetical protein EON77_01070 [bacterium]|nr:MAG: hypothetical protein EON77_01070 [bacterium]